MNPYVHALIVDYFLMIPIGSTRLHVPSSKEHSARPSHSCYVPTISCRLFFGGIEFDMPIGDPRQTALRPSPIRGLLRERGISKLRCHFRLDDERALGRVMLLCADEVQCIRNSFGRQDQIVMHIYWDGLRSSE